MTYKKFNLWFIPYYLALAAFIVITGYGIIGSIQYMMEANMYQSFQPSPAYLGYDWIIPTMAIGPVGLMFLGAIQIMFDWPQLKIEYYTPEEQEAIENDYIEIMKEKGFTFNEDKDVL